jgi:hypothetical protein
MTAVDEVFAGLDDVPWPDLHHVYGLAGEVLGLLRGLVDPDPAAREYALDAMYGGVHHQGDVYDSTVAALPFLLRIAAASGLPGRAEVIALVASIGGADIVHEQLQDLDPDEDAAEAGYLFVDGNAVVADAYDLWIGLLSDPDSKVRTAIAGVLPACRTSIPVSIAALLAASRSRSVCGLRHCRSWSVSMSMCRCRRRSTGFLASMTRAATQRSPLDSRPTP